ncbi:MAG: hypothetical protein NZL89_05720, partial [Leptospiraceae bacterium]|nr:hypothetical protein [Leptospiraceae bacterium]
LQFGRGSASVDIAGPLTGSTGTPTAAGNATVKSSIAASPQFAILRAFSGIQFNLLPGSSGNHLSTFAQLSVTTVGGLAVQTGLRCAW